MKLKFELVNGYGVLLENKLISDGESYLDYTNKNIHTWNMGKGIHKGKSCWCDVILFAEKELNLEGVPVFDWRDFEIEQEFNKNWFSKYAKFDSDIGKSFSEGYKSNPAKYTEEDLSNAMIMLSGWMLNSKNSSENIMDHIDRIIQSLQKYPKYVVMESKEIKGYTEDGLDYVENYEPKLITNSEGKQEGIIKEIIY